MMIKDYNNIDLNNGNKANNIVTLLKHNIKAPKTWVINYSYIMDVIEKELKIIGDYENNYSLIYNFLNNIPRHIYNEVLGAVEKLKCDNQDVKRFAVRSSHIHEDGNKSSFSGLFQTELNLSNTFNITNAIFHCWRDCFTKDIENYSKKSNIDKIIPCSIIIQEFVITEVSGVAFRSDDIVYINSTYGMAKSIVDGETGFDSWKIDNKNYEILEYENTKNIINIPILSKTNPRKDSEINFLNTDDKVTVNSFNNQDNFVIASLNENMINNPTLTKDKMKELLLICDEVGKKLNIKNYDIEWGISNNEIYIFQCRSLTRKIFTPTKTNYTYLPLVSGEATAHAYFVETETDALNFPENSIIVAKNLSGPVLLATNKAVGCILESKSPLSHSAIIARELGIPAIGAVDRNIIINGAIYKIDGTNGNIELLADDYTDLSDSNKKNYNVTITDKSQEFLKIIKKYESDIK